MVAVAWRYDRVARATTACRPWNCGGVDCSLARSICMSLSVIIVSLVRKLRKNKHTLDESASPLGVPVAAVVAADVIFACGDAI